MRTKTSTNAKVLLFDIETSPIEARVWSIWEQNVGLEQIVKDWTVLSWAAKWSGSKTVMYQDQRKAKDIRDDKKLLQGIWDLLDEADVVVTQNGKSFDSKKLNARFAIHGFQPPSSYKHIDTKLLAKKYFAFTSNKLEYLSGALNKTYKKLKHKKFPGHELWNECLAGNQEAWKEMEKYNKHDVLALEELYTKLRPWGVPVNFGVYSEDEENVCQCTSTKFKKNGFFYSSVGRFQRYKCLGCGAEFRNTKGIRTSYRVGTAR